MTTRYLLAIDPGEVHTGFALFRADVGNDRPWVWKLRDAWTIDGRELAEDRIVEMLHDLPVEQVVIEEFRIYPGQNTWSEVQTAWLIGVVLHHCRRLGIPIKRQKAAVKKPTFAILRSRGTPLRGDTQHAKDAEAHGWFWISNRGTNDG